MKDASFGKTDGDPDDYRAPGFRASVEERAEPTATTVVCETKAQCKELFLQIAKRLDYLALRFTPKPPHPMGFVAKDAKLYWAHTAIAGRCVLSYSIFALAWLGFSLFCVHAILFNMSCHGATLVHGV